MEVKSPDLAYLGKSLLYSFRFINLKSAAIILRIVRAKRLKFESVYGARSKSCA